MGFCQTYKFNPKPDDPRKIKQNFVSGAEAAISEYISAVKKDVDQADKKLESDIRSLELEAMSQIIGAKFITEAERKTLVTIGRIVKSDNLLDICKSNKVKIDKKTDHILGALYLHQQVAKGGDGKIDKKIKDATQKVIGGRIERCQATRLMHKMQKGSLIFETKEKIKEGVSLLGQSESDFEAVFNLVDDDKKAIADYRAVLDGIKTNVKNEC